MDEICDSVGSLSLQSSPVSVNDSGSNMVSPEKTMLVSRDMMVSATADEYQSRTLDDNGNKRAVRCFDGELESTMDTTAPFEQSAPLDIAEVETTHNTKRTSNKCGKVEADYVCLQMLKTVMTQESSITSMLKEEGSKKSKKDLFKEIGQAWHKSSDERINKIKDNNLSYNCKKILDCVQDLLSEEQLYCSEQLVRRTDAEHPVTRHAIPRVPQCSNLCFYVEIEYHGKQRGVKIEIAPVDL
jgi:hypothetical protein